MNDWISKARNNLVYESSLVNELLPIFCDTAGLNTEGTTKMNMLQVGNESYNLSVMEKYDFTLFSITKELSDGDIYRIEVIITFPQTALVLKETTQQWDFLKAIGDHQAARLDKEDEECLIYYVKKTYEYEKIKARKDKL